MRSTQPKNGLVEELGGHQEPGLAPGAAAQLDRERGAVERADVVERHDRRAAGRHMLDADDPDAEQRCTTARRAAGRSATTGSIRLPPRCGCYAAASERAPQSKRITVRITSPARIARNDSAMASSVNGAIARHQAGEVEPAVGGGLEPRGEVLGERDRRRR